MKCWISLSLLPLLITAVGCAGSGSTPAKTTQSTDTTTTTQPERTDPLYSLTLMRQGSVLLQQEQYEEALSRFEQADRIAPNNPTVHNMIGICGLRMSEYDKALSAFNTALILNPSFTDARNNRGTTFLAIGQLRLAKVDFLAVLGDSTYPHRYQVYFNLGTTYLQQGHLGAAEENFRRAITAPFPVYQAFVQLAGIYLDQGREEEALDLLEDAEFRFPNRPDASFELGKTLMQLGRIEEARPYLEDVISKEPGSERARQAEALLDSI